jgi:acyl dehydratase
MAIGRFPVESGAVLTFARAIGDDNPVYTSAAAAAEVGLSGIAAPPTFVQASAHFDPDYPLRPGPSLPWFGSGKEPGTSDPRGAGVLHAEQHFEYHRPLVVGDVLSATVSDGATWQKEGRRGGKLTFGEQITEYRDEAGEPVVTARVMWVRTERKPEEFQ